MKIIILNCFFLLKVLTWIGDKMGIIPFLPFISLSTAFEKIKEYLLQWVRGAMRI